MSLGEIPPHGLLYYDPNLVHSHVVALTNIAAALFCLGRPDEAEKHWLKAAKLCPGYLESTEHLVGLLYRKRSKEAVDIITFVQNALRLPETDHQLVRESSLP